MSQTIKENEMKMPVAKYWREFEPVRLVLITGAMM